MSKTFGLVQTAAPATEPITVDEVKRQAAITGTADDTYLGELIARIRADCERVTERQLVTATYKMILDEWPEDDVIRLPKGPTQAVTSVKYYDTGGVLRTIDSADYVVANSGMYGRIHLAEGEQWPELADRPAAIEVIFVAGYGAASAVPADIKGAMRQAVAYCYQQRENADQDVIDALFARFWGGVY